MLDSLGFKHKSYVICGKKKLYKMFEILISNVTVSEFGAVTKIIKYL